MAQTDPAIMIEALEQILIERKWLGPGELEQRAQQILVQRVARGEPIPGESEG